MQSLIKSQNQSPFLYNGMPVVFKSFQYLVIYFDKISFSTISYQPYHENNCCISARIVILMHH